MKLKHIKYSMSIKLKQLKMTFKQLVYTVLKIYLIESKHKK